eukprot:gene1169-1276_t
MSALVFLGLLCVLCFGLVLLKPFWSLSTNSVLPLDSVPPLPGDEEAAAAIDPAVLMPNGRINIERHLERANANWTFVGQLDGVDTFSRQIVGSKLLGFRGVMAIDLHISDVLGPFVNVSQSLEWVHVLKYVERLPVSNPITKQEEPFIDHIYQILRLPWPITPRDILLRRRFLVNPDQKQITISYHSVEDDRVPELPGMIRAFSPFTMWRFTVINEEEEEEEEDSCSADPRKDVVSPTAPSFTEQSAAKRSIPWHKTLGSKAKAFFAKAGDIIINKKDKKAKESHDNGFVRSEEPVPEAEQIDADGFCSQSRSFTNVLDTSSAGVRGALLKGKTLLEVESMVDSRGSISSWFINYMQRYWPSSTLNTFQRLAKKGRFQPDSRLFCW